MFEASLGYTERLSLKIQTKELGVYHSGIVLAWYQQGLGLIPSTVKTNKTAK